MWFKSYFIIYFILDGEEKIYGGCEGFDVMYVKLIFFDGYEFIVKREYVLILGIIKVMLSGLGRYICLIFFSIGLFLIFDGCVFKLCCKFFSWIKWFIILKEREIVIVLIILLYDYFVLEKKLVFWG